MFPVIIAAGIVVLFLLLNKKPTPCATFDKLYRKAHEATPTGERSVFVGPYTVIDTKGSARDCIWVATLGKETVEITSAMIEQGIYVTETVMHEETDI